MTPASMAHRWKPSAAMLLAIMALLLACAGQQPPPSSPLRSSLHLDDAGRARIDSVLQAAVRDSVFPGAVVVVGTADTVLMLRAAGRMGHGGLDAPMREDAIFDLASLTKVVATTTAAMLLSERGQIDLDAPVQRYLPAFNGTGKERVTLRHLLAHTSGLPPFKRYFLESLPPGAIVTRILQEPLEFEPGSETRYSDLGMILLAKIIENISGQSLDRFCQEQIFIPLGMRDTSFNPPAYLADRIPPTEYDPWRGRMVHGVVHDENAFALGGVAGHAGLFSTAADLTTFLQMLLNDGTFAGVQLLKPATISQFTRRQNLVAGSTRALGWDTRSAENSSSGSYFSTDAYGHTGFTGTSVWVDPGRRLFVILLSNRVHPTRENRKIIRFRPQLHDAVMQAVKLP